MTSLHKSLMPTQNHKPASNSLACTHKESVSEVGFQSPHTIKVESSVSFQFRLCELSLYGTVAPARLSRCREFMIPFQPRRQRKKRSYTKGQ